MEFNHFLSSSSFSSVATVWDSYFFYAPFIVRTDRVEKQLLQWIVQILILSSFFNYVLCLRHSWHCTNSEMYFFIMFSTCLWVKMFFITKFHDLLPRPWLPIEPELPPRSYKMKFITWSGCRLRVWQMFWKLVIAVFFAPCLITWGGWMAIFVFSPRSGLYFVNVSTTLFSKSLYLRSLSFLFSSSFSSLAFSPSTL